MKKRVLYSVVLTVFFAFCFSFASFAQNAQCELWGHARIVIPGREGTCIENGLSDGEKCGRCGEILKQQEVLPKTGHHYKVEFGTKATCQKEGSTDKIYCRDCGLIKQDHTAIPKTEHNFKFFSAVSPTCDMSGYTEGTRCVDCAYIKEGIEVVPPLGHTLITEKGVEPTCTQNGISDKVYCLVCKTVFEDQKEIPKTGHIDIEIPEISPNCQREGLTSGKKCIACGLVIVAQKPLPKGDHYYISEDKVEPTCKSVGYTERTYCAECGDVLLERKEIPKVSHKVQTTIKKATLTSNGSSVSVCTVCGERTAYFEIIRPDKNSIKLSSSSFNYDGKKKEPKVTVKDINGKPFSPEFYSVEYLGEGIEPGKYAVEITFSGNYSGTHTLYFDIKPPKPSVSYTQTLSSVTLSWKKVKGADGYRIYLYNTSSKKWEIVIKSTSLTSYTFKGLKSGTTYKYAVRAFSRNGGTVFGDNTKLSVVTNPPKPEINSISVSKGVVNMKISKSNGASGYVIYYSKYRDKGYKSLGKATGNAFKTTALKKGTYYVRVRAYIKTPLGNIYSPYSSIKSVYVP